MYLYLICWLHSPALLHTLTPRTDIYIGYSSRDGLGRCGDDVGWGETIHLWLSFSSRSLLIHFSFDASSSYSLAWTQPLMDAFLRIHWSGIHHQSLQNPPPSLFEACGRVFPIRPIQLLRSMLNYRSSRVFSFSLLPWRWLSLCKWDLNPLSLLLLLLINALQFLVIYFVRFLVDRSSQTINLIDVPHVHSSSFSLFSLVNDGHLRERTSSRAASLNDLGSPVFAPVLFTRMVECCLVAKLPNRQKPSRRHHHFAPLGYWNPFKRIVFPPNYQRLLEYPQSYFTTDDKDLIFLYAAHLFRPFFSL